ncbi:hypothetical protein Vadar_030395 [Vaccinium darrowii]|uniref:Uncharacterized protein n=1 Tax=Vaccinium darrowii TaxID=229202 RepID=A0ACB7YR53_9ERIC|nr:hypothetical protein Vadar_030395 [Vaccinium darrowii]
MFRLCKKLKGCKEELKVWHRLKFGDLRLKIGAAKDQLAEIQKEQELGPNPSLNATEQHLISSLEDLWQKETMFWHQRSCINWLKLGDRNSRFFHLTTIQRWQRNQIVRLKDSFGAWQLDEKIIGSIIKDHFQNLYAPPTSRDFGDILSLVDPIITSSMNTSLIKPVSPDEVRTAAFQMGSLKAPGSDGFPEFIDKSNHSWDESKLRGCVSADEVKAITQIPISLTNSPDCIIWPHSYSGQYSVKSGYFQLVESVVKEKPSPPSSSYSCPKKMWIELWSIPTAPKASKGRLSEAQARKVFQQLIGGVSYCHNKGVYHRDLKLENILVDAKGNIKISDFGLSAPNYVAPEILSNRGYDGATSDTWSCGGILFVILTGYLPFDDRNLAVLYQKIFKGDAQMPKWLFPRAQDLIKRILDLNPATRIKMAEIKTHDWFKKDCSPANPDDDEETVRIDESLRKHEAEPTEAEQNAELPTLNQRVSADWNVFVPRSLWLL